MFPDVPGSQGQSGASSLSLEPASPGNLKVPPRLNLLPSWLSSRSERPAGKQPQAQLAQCGIALAARPPWRRWGEGLRAILLSLFSKSGCWKDKVRGATNSLFFTSSNLGLRLPGGVAVGVRPTPVDSQSGCQPILGSQHFCPGVGFMSMGNSNS